MKQPTENLRQDLNRPEYRRGAAAPWDISPATHQLAREADATMSPDGWEADYTSSAGTPESPPESPPAVADTLSAAASAAVGDGTE